MRKFTTKIVVFVIFSCIIISTIKNYRVNRTNFTSQRRLKEPGMKYILLWTNQENIPFLYLGQGQTGFISRNCSYTNCIVSGKKTDLESVTEFDAVLFAGPELMDEYLNLPDKRLPYQKYVFASIESPGNYPLCLHNFNGYFNWTWTYKLDSDLRWGYIAIKDSSGNVVGPRKDMNWIDWKDMESVDDDFKQQLSTKNKAVAWFVSNCYSKNKREHYVSLLREELLYFDLDIDVFGRCGPYTCSRDKQDECNAMISKDYYFYLAFENDFSEDYVTEKLLHAVQNNAVPIVFGGANYSRFLPEYSYLDAEKLGPSNLAQLIFDLIGNLPAYAQLFRWKKYYSYHKTTELEETNEYCKMCEALNDEELVKTTSVYDDFSNFWEFYHTC